MRIAIGCDHVGFSLKRAIADMLESDAHAVLDLGVHSRDPVDYPAMAKAIATALVKGFVDVGVLVCDTSLGAMIAANKVGGIRAVACRDAHSARESRVRLDANVLCLAGSEVDGDDAVAVVREWLSAAFSADERDVRVLAGIDELAETVRHRPRPAPAKPTTPAQPPEPEVTRAPDISEVLRFIASLKDEDVQLMARRVLEIIRNRFPAAEGVPSANGFTFTLEGRHVATLTIVKKQIELEVGAARVATGRIRDLDGIQVALNQTNIAKGLDALKS